MAGAIKNKWNGYKLVELLTILLRKQGIGNETTLLFQPKVKY